MSLSSTLSLSAISNYIFYTTPRELDSLPDICQGVYAWYAPPPSKVTPPIDEKTYLHYATICGASGEETILGKRYRAGIYKKPVPRQSYFTKSLTNSQAIEISAIASLFSPPLYVGKACGKEGIKGRLKQESSSSDFRSKFLNFKNCLIKYIDVKSLLLEQLHSEEEGDEEDSIEDACRFLEQAVFWAGFPPLNTKMGV